MEDNNVKALNELSKGASMGIDATNFILEKTDDDKLKTFLKASFDKYQALLNKIKEVYTNYSSDKVKETNAMNKVMTWYTLELKTITDSTSSKLAEILFQGFNMGIAEGRKLLNHKDTSKEVNDLIKEYVKIQEDCAAQVKDFL